jgi:phage shock protein PspC (stress-responsive transcriptional regulator)
MDEPTNIDTGEHHDDAAPPAAERTERSTLHRSRTKHVFGGVCGGLGERFDIDANIVRVVFVVLSIVYGLGVVVYLAMWALIPRAPSLEGDEVVAEVEPRPRSRWLRIVTPLSVVVLLLLVIVLFVHAGRGNHGPSLAGLHFAKGLVVLWLIFLLFLAIISLRSPHRDFSFRRFFAWMILGVTSALTLLVGAFLILIQVIGVPLEGGSGVKGWTPTSIAQVQHSYHGAFGESTLNLTEVPFGAGTWSITATQGFGTLIVDVPADVVVGLRTHVGIGAVNGSYVVVRGPVASSHRGVTRLDLNLQVGIGSIEIRRDVR